MSLLAYVLRLIVIFLTYWSISPRNRNNCHVSRLHSSRVFLEKD